MTVPQSDSTFTDRYRAVMQAWEAGDLNIKQAERDLEALRDEAHDAGDLMGEGNVALNLGILHGYNGQFVSSARYFDTARELFTEAGADREVVTCELNIGEVYRLQGNFTRAQLFFRRAYEHGKKIDDIRTVVVSLTNEGQMWLSMGSDKKALASLEEALGLAQHPYSGDETERVQLARLTVLAEIHHALTQICLHQDDAQAAWSHAKQAHVYAQQAGQPMALGLSNRALANALTALGGAPKGEKFDGNPDIYYKAALTYFKKVKMEADIAKTLVARGKSLIQRGKTPSAARLLQRALVIFTKLGMTDDAAKTAEIQIQATL